MFDLHEQLTKPVRSDHKTTGDLTRAAMRGGLRGYRDVSSRVRTERQVRAASLAETSVGCAVVGVSLSEIAISDGYRSLTLLKQVLT